MAIKGIKKNNNQEKIDIKNKKKGQPNWILRITVVVLLIPVVIVVYVLLTSIETKGKPVFGDRFDEQLKNTIEDSKLKEVETALAYDNVESVSVNLNSATLRITINAIDTIDRASIEALVNDAYQRVIAILPVESYFTNLQEGDKTIKMYDLEISAYNFIPADENQQGQLHVMLAKNAPSSEVVGTWLSDIKNEEVRKSVENITE